MTRTLCAILAAFFPLLALAQLPAAQPQSVDFLSSVVEMEVRLKTPDGRTAKLYHPTFPKGLNFGVFVRDIPCWNKASACPAVNAITVQIFLRLPWYDVRYNVTRYVLGKGSEVQLWHDDGSAAGSPTFPAISAAPGQAYRIRYDRIKGRITPAPSVVPAVIN